jgi:hypothetical protein
MLHQRYFGERLCARVPETFTVQVNAPSGEYPLDIVLDAERASVEDIKSQVESKLGIASSRQELYRSEERWQPKDQDGTMSGEPVGSSEVFKGPCSLVMCVKPEITWVVQGEPQFVAQGEVLEKKKARKASGDELSTRADKINSFAKSVDRIDRSEEHEQGVRWTVDSTSSAYAIGLTSGSSGQQQLGKAALHMDYELACSRHGDIDVYENGEYRQTCPAECTAGDELAIKVKGDSVRCFHNGKLLCIFEKGPSFPLLISAAFKDPGARAEGVRQLFGGEQEQDQEQMQEKDQDQDQDQELTSMTGCGRDWAKRAATCCIHTAADTHTLAPSATGNWLATFSSAAFSSSASPPCTSSLYMPDRSINNISPPGGLMLSADV